MQDFETARELTNRANALVLKGELPKDGLTIKLADCLDNALRRCARYEMLYRRYRELFEGQERITEMLKRLESEE